jgi:hypothetical protein
VSRIINGLVFAGRRRGPPRERKQLVTSEGQNFITSDGDNFKVKS